MVRSLFIAIIATTYLLFSSGVVVNVHYCMNAIASVSFGYEGDHSDGSCNKCGMDKGAFDCCKDEVREIKLDDAHQPSIIAYSIACLSEHVPQLSSNCLSPVQGYVPEPYAFCDIPPPLTGNKRYRSLNVFRI